MKQHFWHISNTAVPFQLEEREYSDRKWVCTKRGPEDKGTQGETGMFWRLFNYISGENESSKPLLSFFNLT
jgi:hypothetical protein